MWYSYPYILYPFYSCDHNASSKRIRSVHCIANTVGKRGVVRRKVPGTWSQQERYLAYLIACTVVLVYACLLAMVNAPVELMSSKYVPGTWYMVPNCTKIWWYFELNINPRTVIRQSLFWTLELYFSDFEPIIRAGPHFRARRWKSTRISVGYSSIVNWRLLFTCRTGKFEWETPLNSEISIFFMYP